MAAMRDVSATETAIIYGLEPLWGAGFAWILLDESNKFLPNLNGSFWIIVFSIVPKVYNLLRKERRKEFDDLESFGESLSRWKLNGANMRISSSSLPSSAKNTEPGNPLSITDKQSGISASPIVVSSRKDFSNILKK